MSAERLPTWRSAFAAALIFGSVALGFTLLGMFLGPSEAQVGGVRPEDTIAPHLAALAAFGLVLGLGGMLVYGRRGLPLVFLAPSLTIMLDIDHLPVYLGFSEPIRPAHSLIFLAFVLGIAAITIKALDIELVMASAFMGHMAVDTGIFAPFSPLSLQYFQLDPYRLLFAAGALVCALSAGLVLRMRSPTATGGKQEDV
jgi:hypothetical protein